MPIIHLVILQIIRLILTANLYFQCLVFEDAPNGVKAAVNAEMQVVMVPEDYVPKEDRQLATHVIESLNDFQPELFGLPPFPK